MDILSLVFMIISLMLCFGFYTGSADWLMIYYGCAPNKLKEKVDRKKILSITSCSFAIISAILFIAVALSIVVPAFETLRLVVKLAALAVFIYMVAYTANMCYKAYKKK